MSCSNSFFVYRGNSQPELERLLSDRLDHPDKRAAIDNHIRELFVETYAVLVLDSAGFSRGCQQSNIIEALARVEQMRRTLVPLFEQQGGQIFKIEVDNIYAVFPNVATALTVSRESIKRLAPLNMQASIGIGYGELLMMAEPTHYNNVYGVEMNLASKLGEDVAAANEIWLTEAAAQCLDPEQDAVESHVIHISGLDLKAYRCRQEQLS
ncbi:MULTISPECIES: adenylate/guanylate cyclase domain-containing protein [unclassified Leptolyngbya]|jgi:adenylate cyclase|uniref:adenylate/guanylate cyclase domain-containing protein n=1 Tax=unclassified Leptolyngbya TaxID=2650499 RepID=UPI00168752AD|nr:MULTISPECIES: adenylate/guanylate cyclase domain-containing protein [unclassified Leptolyngbya]MBD1911217.1 adenylate/guanylate cyclase domain-containing protein [Leptolyngbya sp. FACHB-8]MBD2155464.1 adenylate/guanylate cyclase domain-containing protein [Leptolyngbya sp. FACHB-16]